MFCKSLSRLYFSPEFYYLGNQKESLLPMETMANYKKCMHVKHRNFRSKLEV